MAAHVHFLMLELLKIAKFNDPDVCMGSHNNGAPNQSIFPTFSYGLFDFLYAHFLLAQLDFSHAQLDLLYGQLIAFYMVYSFLI